jgi:uroporphyrin-III C-methyltransferase/precorrin-2 dehydrogenase/sirohydrochlorin ferrochelatase
MPVFRQPVEIEAAPKARETRATRAGLALVARRRAERDTASAEFAGSAAPVGRVSLIGCGPGDVELLTLRAVRLLGEADVVLTDDLVDDDVLALARPGAARIRVGKRGGRESCRQDDINSLMVRLASQGRHVVRLKSGDPMIFGRAGEEIDACRAAGIPIEVVPGVSAAFGLASRLQVSLTHRDHAQSVRFVTGHARTGQLPDDLDWAGLAHARTTLIVYMGARTAGALASRLIAAGRSGETPVVVAVGVARPDERFETLRLVDLGAGLPGDVDGPVLIGIGEVFATAPERVRALADADAHATAEV